MYAKIPTIYELIRTHAEEAPTAPVIHAPNQSSLTYEGLSSQVDYVVNTFNLRGIRPCDRVAIVLPDGPEMAVACLAVAAAVTCAPLNPAHSVSEFDFYLSDIKPKALIVHSTLKDSIIGFVERHRIPIIELTPSTAGRFVLKTTLQGLASEIDFPRTNSVALILHTSGTTSRPKMVPLTHANLLASARSIASTLQLNERDRCLNVMPLFHIHGLVGALLSSIIVGASVICASNFDPEHFFSLLEEFCPTWYTAVPTIHHAILSRARASGIELKNHSLRFIRSSSAALPVRTMQGLEKLFKVPVIEAYGMTEAAHQIASNPLPPAARKSGSVGKAAGPEVAVINDEDHLQSPGTIGEVAICGANVISGYEGDKDNNAATFVQGWFRTGDQGYLDDDGYLFLTGRLKETINRGGEKFAPREIDDVLLAHPAVDQAVALGIPHPTLGEEVAAVVVLRPESQTTVKELKEFSANRLANFKVPKHILIVDNIPKTATGKLQRVGLAEKLMLSPSVHDGNGDGEEVERKIAHIFAEVLEIETVGLTDNFFILGGDSLRATDAASRISDTLKVNISVATILWYSTARELAHEILRIIATADDLWSTYPSTVVPFRSNGSKTPLFWFNWGYWDFRLPQYLGSDQPVYGLQHQSHDGQRALYTRIEDMATHYVRQIRTVQTEGPYFLAGLCIGGIVAFEMAHQLREQGEEVALLVLLDPRNREGELLPSPSDPPTLTSGLIWLHHKISHQLRGLARDPRGKLINIFGRATNGISGLPDNLTWIVRRALCEVFGFPLPAPLRAKYIEQIYDRAAKNYLPKPYRGQVILFRTRGRYNCGQFSWGNFISDGLETEDLDADHENVLKEPYVKIFAEKLKSRLTQQQQRAKPLRYIHATSPDRSNDYR